MSDRIEKSVHLAAPIDRVWRALTDHDEFGAWFGVKIDAPFVAGAPSRGRITYPGFEHVVWQATIERIEPPTLFSFRWNPYAIDPNVDYSDEEPTLVEFRLTPDGTGTRLTVTESGFDRVPAHRRAEAFRMNEGGWAQQMENIRNHVGG